MILTDYYLLQELKVIKSHRFDCIASTGGYIPFETIAQRTKDKKLFLYYSEVPNTFKSDIKRKADRVLTNGNNISSVFIPELENPYLGYGDTKGTNDALLFRFSEDYKQLEIFVARGYKNNVKGLFNLFYDGELNEEINKLKSKINVI